MNLFQRLEKAGVSESTLSAVGAVMISFQEESDYFEDPSEAFFCHIVGISSLLVAQQRQAEAELVMETYFNEKD